ncbi:CU044_2847 family protein [Micromonospora echinofusca]|uniref:Trypsin-co-occurring domain-containing protein n=1 Tax=Micromonospora echinofusca TaxID=47858 RepID=A0ABS3W0M7_MICEH|nr:CU044_2847 family protein [Micromonospora echinofusca]MBO4210335.1 hypothetical protein [Micromonospora echinofusca]
MANETIRTEDGTRFHVETDQRYVSPRAGEPGRLVRQRQQFGEVIRQVARSVSSGLAGTRADSVRIQFGLVMDAEGVVTVTRGTEAANLVVTLEYSNGPADVPSGADG